MGDPEGAAPSVPRCVRLDPGDNLVVAVDTLARGVTVAGVVATERIPRGHKMAVAPLPAGAPIVKFGQIIGFAATAIAPGTWLHEHNVELRDFARETGGAGALAARLAAAIEPPASFEGFRRADGKVGTRNYVGILSSVNCSATAARFMAEELVRSGALAAFPNIDGIVPLVHGTGCAMDTEGEGFELLKRTQWGYAANPNMAAVIMVGLGCEAFQIDRWKQEYGIVEGERFRSLTIQQTGGTRRTVEAGVAAIREMLPLANAVRRERVPASHLMLALQCGGSDGYSGITANPALGVAADLLVAQGGTAILSETPEIYGAEHLLARRAVTPEIRDRLMGLIRWWEDYAARHRGVMNNNPSPGNKAGGLTTILEKSLGAAAKGGSSPLAGVYRYAEPVTAKGLVFMDTPGFDPVAATGQIAGGANVLAFTTGRGSAFGSKPTPSLKLATNTPMYERMAEDMDINCGDILDGVSIEDKGREIFGRILDVASGHRTKSEQLGYGDHEFVPWQIGATM
ncbi:UxaA family hydrolase [Ancylobacter sp.]|uniref:UxaA family hydrolase n=1 Tax=Ancylobacter sp. TaxID=1872567 RepID=UPI003D11F70D